MPKKLQLIVISLLYAISSLKLMIKLLSYSRTQYVLRNEKEKYLMCSIYSERNAISATYRCEKCKGNINFFKLKDLTRLKSRK